MTSAGANDELIDLLRKTPVVLRAVVAGLDNDRVQSRDAGGWSTVEIIGHLIDAERRAIERITLIQQDTAPVLSGYDQAAMVADRGYQSRDLAELLAEFEALRSTRVAALNALDSAAWDRSAVLANGDVLTLQNITMHMCWHDMNHLAQIAGIRQDGK